MKFNSPFTIVVFVLLAIIFISQSTLAGFIDGNTLIKNMREYDMAERGDRNTNFSAANAYRSYVAGVFDAIVSTLCITKNISLGQTIAIVAKYLKEHPENWGNPAFEQVRSALLHAFPCN
jgi:hypothetical protein